MRMSPVNDRPSIIVHITEGRIEGIDGLAIPVPQSPDVKLAYTLKEAAVATGHSLSFLRRRISAGELVARRSGDKIVIHHADLDAWLRGLPVIGEADF